MSDGFDRRKNIPNPEMGRPVSGQAEPKPPIQARQATRFSPNKWVLYIGIAGTVLAFILVYLFVLGGRT